MKITNVTPSTLSAKSLELVNLYQEVFGTPPWNEWRKCQICESYWGKFEDIPHEHCGKNVVSYWDHDIMTEVFAKYALDPSTVFLVSENNDSEYIGFTIGKVGSRDEVFSFVDGKGADKYSDSDGATIFAYQTDLGVREDMRRHGVAKELFKQRHTELIALGAKFFVVRTNTQSPMFQWLLRLGYSVIADYADEGQPWRVVLSVSIDDILI